MQTSIEVPPHNKPAELAVCGDLLNSGSAAFARIDGLQPDDFYIIAAKRVYQAALDLHDKGKQICPVTVAELLEREGTLEEVGGVPALAEMMDNADPRWTDQYVRQIAETSKRRKLNRKLLRMADDSVNSSVELNDLYAELWEESREQPISGVSSFTLSELTTEYPELRAPVIDGLLRRGEVGNLISSSKAGKSWCAMGAAVSVSTGADLLGFPTRSGRVLYIDNELNLETLSFRFREVAAAYGYVPSALRGIDVVSLRGQLVDLHQLEKLLKRKAENGISLIILDAFYRFVPVGTSENDNAAVTQLYNLLDSIARDLDTAILLVHHSTKGNQSEKRTTDVGAGAGSQSRAADCHIVIREHERGEEYAVMGAAVRSFPPVEPVTIRFEFPRWYRDENVQPELKRSATRGEAKQSAKDQEGCQKIIDTFTETGEPELSVNKIRSATGIGRDRVTRLVNKLIDDGELVVSRQERLKNGEFATYYTPQRNGKSDAIANVY